MVVEQDSLRGPVSSAEFATWVRPHLLVMRRLAARLAPNEDPDDVVQEALLRAWRKHGTYDATPRSRWLPLTAAAGVATLVAAVALGAHLLNGSGTDPVTGIRPHPLRPDATASDGVPTTFVGVYEHGSGDLKRRRQRLLALLSTADGRPVRNLAVTTANGFSALADPSRGPNGDVWFVRAPGPCGGRIVRIDAATGRASVVVNRSGVNVGGPVASPDGRWLAFRESSCDPRNSANQLVLRDLSTGRERHVLPVDARGRAGKVPTPTKLEAGPAGTARGAVRIPPVPAFRSAPAWSPDSSRLAIVHISALGSTGVGAGVSVLDVATGRQVRRLAAPAGCSYWSVAYDEGGLALGETGAEESTRPRSAVVQFDADTGHVLSRHPLAACSAYPEITASGDRRQVLLITAYVFCGGSSDPAQRVQVLLDGRLRTVHDYAGPAEFLSGATW